MNPCLGILAGQGGLVEALVSACQEEGRPYFIIALEGQSDPDFVKEHPHAWVGLAQIGKTLSHLRAAGARDIVMVGAVKRPSFKSLKPDFVGAKWLAQMVGHVRGDDALLRFIADKLEAEGFRVVGVESLVGKTLLGERGCLTKKAPSAQNLLDIERGRALLLALSAQDVGQAVVVQDGLILGIEAIEGTQALIARVGTLARPSSTRPTLVKMPKTSQDMRLDRPTLGPLTCDALVEAGFAGVAYLGDEVILLAKDEVIAKANAGGLFVYGF